MGALEQFETPEHNKYTALASSGKFKKNLILKQKRLEELLLENRIKKLQMDNLRTTKQIETANKMTQNAVSIR